MTEHPADRVDDIASGHGVPAAPPQTSDQAAAGLIARESGDKPVHDVTPDTAPQADLITPQRDEGATGGGGGGW